MNKSSKTRFVNSLIVSILLTLLFSFNFTVPSVIRELVRDPLKVKDYHKSGLFHITDEAFGRLFVFPCLGAGIGCLLAQVLKLELRRFLILGNAFFTLGTFLQFWLKNYFIFLLARVLIGVGTGIVCAIVPTYLSIISPLEKRGFYCSLQQIALASGFLLASICRYTFNNERWKVPFFSSFVVSLLIYGLLPFVEDPILTQNKGKNLIQLFCTKEAFLSILTGVLLHLSQHLASINVIICYTDEIFKGKHSFHILFNVIQVLFTCINGFFIDKFGRKQLLLLSISISSVALSFLSYNYKESFFAFVYIAGFCIGLGPVIWYLSAEIFPPDYVVTGTSFLSLTNWIWGWIQPKVYFMLKNKYGEKAYLPFTVCLGLVFIYFVMFMKETKGRVSDFQ